MRTRLVLAVLPVALVGVTAASSMAAPKEMKGKFDAAGVPDPTAQATDPCHGVSPAARTTVPLTIPTAGKLKVELTGFQGDWDLAVQAKDGSNMAESAGFIDATTEAIQLKFKKKTEIIIAACNFAGGPTAKGSYVFTPNKK